MNELRTTLYEETVPGGGHTSFVLKRGQVLRLTDIEAAATSACCCSTPPRKASG